MKYEILENISKNVISVKVYRIRALKDFGNVKKGDLGGWIQYPHNLSQEGDCWVYDEACVYGNAKVFGDAKIYDKAQVFDNAKVYKEAKISGYARVFDNSEIYGKSSVYNHAEIFGCAKIYGNAEVFYRAEVFNNTEVYEYAKVSDDAKVFGSAKIFGIAKVFGTAEIYGNARINVGSIQKMKCDNIITFCAGARTIVATKRHYRYELECGCFYASYLDRFVDRVYADGNYQNYDDLPPHRKDYLEFIEFLRAKEQRELPKNTKELQ